MGEPVRCYHKNEKGEYVYYDNAFYVGRGFCVKSFTKIIDDGICVVLTYDRYIPISFYNKVTKELNTDKYQLTDFNCDKIEDLDNGDLCDFWWWQLIQNKIDEEIKK